jgi:hypothetical protein
LRRQVPGSALAPILRATDAKQLGPPYFRDVVLLPTWMKWNWMKE